MCQNQSIDDSAAPLARDLRVIVRERLQAGDTDDQIRAFLVQRYGDFVLLKPPFEASTLLLWGTPFLVVVLGGGAMLLRKRDDEVRQAADGSRAGEARCSDGRRRDADRRIASAETSADRRSAPLGRGPSLVPRPTPPMRIRSALVEPEQEFILPT